MLIYFTHIDWLDECVLFVRLHSFHCIALTIPPRDKNQGLIACCAAGAKKIQNLFIQMLSRVTTFVPDFITILPKSWNKCFTTILLSGQLNSKFLYAIFLFSCHTFREHNEKVLQREMSDISKANILHQLQAHLIITYSPMLHPSLNLCHITV